MSETPLTSSGPFTTERAVEKARIKTRGVLLATAGLGLALAILGITRIADYTHFTLLEFLSVVALTVGVQAVVLLIVRLGLDQKIGWDRHYVYVPLIAAAGLICSYIYIAPQIRLIALICWVTATLFVAGLAGFFGVMGLTLAMTLAYLFVVFLLRSRGQDLGPVSFDLMVAAIYMSVNLYGGIVFERLKRDRAEMMLLRKRLAELALQDPLTNLPNRRYYENIIESELSRIARHGGACALCLIDIDHFKNFNDTLGHPAGDRLLREMGVIVRSQLRVSDVLVRLGGDEFAIVMPSTDEAEAERGMERIRRGIENHEFAGRKVQPGGVMTVSAGVAASGDMTMTPGSLMEAADGALYAAKRGGRNRVVSVTALAAEAEVTE